MIRVEGEVKETRRAFVAFDKQDGFIAKHIGCVRHLLDWLSAAHDRVAVRLVLQIAMRPSKETKELVETSSLRVKLRFEAEMPLANKRRCVAVGLQPICHCRFGQRQPEVRVCILYRAGVELVAKALLVASGE